MSCARRSRPTGPLTRWARDPSWRRFAVWPLRSSVPLPVLLIGYLVILNALLLMMTNGIVSQMTNF